MFNLIKSFFVKPKVKTRKAANKTRNNKSRRKYPYIYAMKVGDSLKTDNVNHVKCVRNVSFRYKKKKFDVISNNGVYYIERVK